MKHYLFNIWNGQTKHIACFSSLTAVYVLNLYEYCFGKHVSLKLKQHKFIGLFYKYNINQKLILKRGFSLKCTVKSWA